ncbi:15542_t:CDS:2, partial [Dentiscutata heterogama]
DKGTGKSDLCKELFPEIYEKDDMKQFENYNNEEFNYNRDTENQINPRIEKENIDDITDRVITNISKSKPEDQVIVASKYIAESLTNQQQEDQYSKQIYQANYEELNINSKKTFNSEDLLVENDLFDNNILDI